MPQENNTLVWPSGSSLTEIVTPDPLFVSSNADLGALRESDDWGAYRLMNETSSGGSFPHELQPFPISGYPNSYSPPNIKPLSATIIGFRKWTISFPNGRNYTPPAGILGLGPGPSSGSSDPSLLQQWKGSGAIASRFCGLHMGSAVLNQPGSMILGGYDQNRVLGEVGTFFLSIPELVGPQGITSSIGGPQAYILDVALDVETGDSPSNQSDRISVWHSINDQYGATPSVAAGGKIGSRLVTTSPSVPYMYLPKGLCETAAQYLPVTWNASLELYIWDMSSQYARIVGSSAYMPIVLADAFAKNITIKVPFQVLNLTLGPPIVDTPISYFPCKPYDDKSYVLGRAFLQAAFLGFEFEHNLAYIAQAPGPSMEQSMIKTFQPTDKTITANVLGTFASSWASSWTILHDSKSGSNSTSNSTNSSTSTSSGSATTIAQPTTASQSHQGFSAGAVAGAVIGSVLGTVATIAFATIIWRKRKITRQTATAETSSVSAVPLFKDLSANITKHSPELDSRSKPSELHGHARPHEMGTSDPLQELNTHELPLARIS